MKRCCVLVCYIVQYMVISMYSQCYSDMYWVPLPFGPVWGEWENKQGRVSVCILPGTTCDIAIYQYVT